MESMSTPTQLPSCPPGEPERATHADWLAAVEAGHPAELINGCLVYKAMATLRHGRAQHKISAVLDPYDRRRIGDAPGWWLATEVDIGLGDDRVRPDLAGWRRARYPELPREDPALRVITAPPDWVCEVLSKGTAHRDTGAKLTIYHRAEVAHYWLIDPVYQALTVYRWQPDGYLLVLAAHGTAPVVPEPFPESKIIPADLFDEESNE